MSKREVDAVIAGLNPVEINAVESLPLGETERELVAAITAEPAERPSRGSFPVRLAGRRSLALGGAIAALAAAVLIVGGAGGGTTAGPDAALGEDITELLKASPPILIDAPDWRVHKLNEPFESQGTVIFSRRSAPLNEPGGAKEFAELQWRVEPLRKRIQAVRAIPRVMRRTARRLSIELAPYRQWETSAPVLGTTAKVFILLESHPRMLAGTAIWKHRGHTFQFRSFSADVAGFKRRLALLREVGYRAWRDALPLRIEKRDRGIFATNQRDKGEGR